MESQFSFTGQIDVVYTEEEADAAVSKLRANAAVSKLSSDTLVGFDMEWHTPRVTGVSPGRTSLIQICSSAEYCSVFAVLDWENLAPSLRAFLRDPSIRKVGLIVTSPIRVREARVWITCHANRFVVFFPIDKYCVVIAASICDTKQMTPWRYIFPRHGGCLKSSENTFKKKAVMLNNPEITALRFVFILPLWVVRVV